MHTLFLRLEGPLQAWGLRARWGERDTADAPSKSGLLGLLGCALGLSREDPMLRELSDQLRLGVRVDRPGTLLRDYHTTGGGRYGDAVHSGGTRFHDQPYVGGVLSAKVSKSRIYVKINQSTGEPETDVSERYYLADASFLAALQGDNPALIERLAAALQAPAWPCFLGRKSCVPSAPIFAGTGDYPSLRAALEAGPFSPRVLAGWERAGQRPAQLRLLLEVEPGEGNRQNDNIGTPARRVFRPRYVREEWWTLPAPEPAAPAPDVPPVIDTREG
nr:MAG: type I-E CRISPR-associated protein Cas5/CasD [Chloroflexota bacterium]